MSTSLKGKFISGTLWTISQNIILTLLGIVQLAVTSRLLSPLDFGIYAIALFFSGLGSKAFAMGLSIALIQKKGKIEGYFDTVWSVSILVATSAILLLLLLLFPICHFFYHLDEAVIPSMVILIGTIFSAAGNPATIYFLKDIKLKKYFILNVVPKILSFILVLIGAYLLKSYWALIIAIVAEHFLHFIFSFILISYKPRFKIDKKQFYELYSFGGWLQLKNIFAWLAGNIDVAIVGNALGPLSLGLYNRAQSISNYPRTFIDSVINNVAYPLYSQINDDLERTKTIILKIQNVVLFFISILAVIVILYGDWIVLIVLGSSWMQMVTPFKIIFIAYLFHSILLSFNPVFRSFGFSKQEFKFYSIEIIGMIMLMYPFTKLWDLTGTGVSILVSIILIFPYLIHELEKKTHLSFLPIFKSIVITIVSISFTCSAMWFVPKTDSIILVLVGMFLSVVILLLLFVSIALLFHIGPGLYVINLMKKRHV